MTKSCISTFYINFEKEHAQMLKSLHHFHPEVTVETLNRKLCRVIGLHRMNWAYPIIELPLFDRYDTVTHIDADVLVVDKIDELWDDSTDVRAGRNNTDTNRCANVPGITLPGLHWPLYVNAGIHSVSNRQFMEDWFNWTQEHGQLYPHVENDTFNVIFHNGKYKSKILDPVRSDVYWGTSIVMGKHNFWEKWKQIEVQGDHLVLWGKRVKLLHEAGGSPTRPPIESLLSPQVVCYLKDNKIL